MRLSVFGPDIWIADGPPVRAFGPIRLPTRMIVVRLNDGSLWINSPVVASQKDMDSLRELGDVRYLIAPTRLHVWRLDAWKRAFPSAELWGPPQRRARTAKSAFDGVLDDQPPAAWGLDLDQVILRGNALFDEVEFFHKKSRTLIFTDFIQIYRAWSGVPLDVRLTFTKRDLGRQSMRKILAWDFERLIVAHGACIQSGAKPFVVRAFGWLVKSGTSG